MLELIADPAAVAVIGTLSGGILLRAGEKFVAKRKTATAKAVVAPKPVIPKFTDAYLCSVWEIRHREASPFHGSGISQVPLAEMTVCSDPKCANCAPTRAAIRKVEQQEFARELRKTRERAVAEKQKAEALKAAARKRAAEIEAQKFSYVNGMKILRPQAVPHGASGKIHRDPQTWRDFVIWTWPSPQTGDTLYYRQPIDAENYEEVSGDGTVVLQWTAIYDPDTGEHLGDYRVTPDAGTEVRNPVKKMPNKYEQEKFEKQMKEINQKLKVGFMNMGDNVLDHRALEAPEISSRRAKR